MNFYEWHKSLEDYFYGLKDGLEMEDSDIYSTVGSVTFDITGTKTTGDYHNSKIEKRVISLEDKRNNYYKALDILGSVLFTLSDMAFSSKPIDGTKFKINDSVELIRSTLSGESPKNIRKKMKVNIKVYETVETAGLRLLKDRLINQGYDINFEI